MAGYTSPLGKLGPNAPEAERVKQAAWREDKILVVRLDDERLDMIDREFIARIGEPQYGRPKVFTSKDKTR
jgi:hypothetical protein